MSFFRRRGSNEGSLPLAILVSIIVAGVVVVLVARTVTAQRQVQFDQSYHGALPAADAGVEVSQFRLNNGVDLLSSSGVVQSADSFAVHESTQPETREIDGRTYTWTMTRQAGGWAVDSRAVDDRGRSEVDRRILVTLRDQPLIGLAAFADLMFNMKGANTADSYNSAEGGEWCTGNGIIASNDVVVFQGTGSGPCQTHNQRRVDQVVLYDWKENAATEGTTTGELPGGDRCGQGADGGPVNNPDIANCKEVTGTDGTVFPRPERVDQDQDLTSPDAIAFMKEALDECGRSGLDDFVASDDELSGVRTLSPAPSDAPKMADLDFGLSTGRYVCYDNVYFDEHTVLDTTATMSDPVIMFVQGEVIMRRSPGPGGQAVTVGCGDGCTPLVDRPTAGRLWIFVEGGGPVQIRNQSSFAGVVWAPLANCEGSPSSASADIFGSIICSEISNQGGWSFHYDEQLGLVSDGKFLRADWREVATAPS